MATKGQKVNAVIANAAALSNAIAVNGIITRIEIPAAWTAAALTFQVSSDGVTFMDLYDDSGTEVIIASASIPTGAVRAIRLTLADWTNLLWLKLRSGTTGTPVNQGAERTIVVVTKHDAP